MTGIPASTIRTRIHAGEIAVITARERRIPNQMKKQTLHEPLGDGDDDTNKNGPTRRANDKRDQPSDTAQRKSALPRNKSQSGRPYRIFSSRGAVFLRVVERGGLTKSELGRSFNRMNKEERETILTNRVGRNLIVIREGVVLKAPV